MGDIKNWFKRNAAALALATSKVEKNALSQDAKPLEDQNSTGVVNPQEQGSVMQALLNGEITEEVQQLRWRTYKVTREADRYKTSMSYNPSTDQYVFEGTEKIKNVEESLKQERDRVTLEPSDEEPLDVMFKNKTVGDAWSWSDYNEDDDQAVEDVIKEDVQLSIERDLFPSYYIENFVDSVYVRSIDDSHKIIEFYITQYEDHEDRIQKMFIKQMEKLYENPKKRDFLDVDKVGFVTDHSTMGAEDSKLFSYTITDFYKITTHGNFYVVKFYGVPDIEDEDLFEKYRKGDLDEKYENKEARDIPLEVDFESMMEGAEESERDNSDIPFNTFISSGMTTNTIS